MLRAEVWLTTTLIAVGIIGGLIYNWPSQLASPAGDESSLTALDQADDPTEAGKPVFDPADFGLGDPDNDPAAAGIGANDIEIGDNYFMVGNYANAYRAYIRATNKKLSENPGSLLIKLGFCAEKAGEWELAESFYHKASIPREHRQSDRLLALCGMARVWQSQNRTDQAMVLLAELFLRFATDEKIPEEVRMQITYQLSTIVQNQFIAKRPTRYGDFHNTLFHWYQPLPDSMISLDNDSTTGVGSPIQSNDVVQIDILHRLSEDINMIGVDVRTPLIPARKLLDELAAKTNINFDLTPKAQEALAGRSLHMNVIALPLSLVIDNVVAPFGLMWDQVGDQVNLRHLDDEPGQVVSYRFQQANRILSRIEISFPRNERRNASLLNRGNLSLMVDDIDAAGTRYQELAQVDPNGEIRAKLSYNQAKLELAAGRYEGAIEKLLHTVDQTFDTQLQAAGYGWIGKIEMENGNLQQAVRAASRGVSLASDPEIRQSNLMTLAKAYLLTNDPFSANKLLFDNSQHLVEDKATRLAAVVATYARFLGTTESLGLRNEGERLIICLASLEPGDVSSFIDELLVGRAFFEVGFSRQSTEHMQSALENATNSNWQRRIAFELGMHQYRSGETELAARIFSEIIGELNDTASLLAQLKLAEIRLNQKQPELCLELCKQLWKSPLNEQQKSATLEMMGNAYRALDRPHAAAVCFSGMVPYDSPRETQVDTPDSDSNVEASVLLDGIPSEEE